MVSILASSYNAKPYYLNELLEIRPETKNAPSKIVSVLSICYTPSDINESPEIRILQRGIIAFPKILYPIQASRNEQITELNKGLNRVSVLASKKGAKYGFQQPRTDETKISLTEKSGNPNILVPSNVIPKVTGIDNIIDDYWPYSILSIKIPPNKDLPTQGLSMVRVKYYVYLDRYRSFGCGIGEPKLPNYKVPYCIFSPEKVHDELHTTEISTALYQYKKEYGKSETEIKKIIATCNNNIKDFYEGTDNFCGAKKWIPKQDLVLFVNSEKAEYDIIDADGATLCPFEENESLFVKGHYVKRQRNKDYQIKIKASQSEPEIHHHLETTVLELGRNINDNVSRLVHSYEKTSFELGQSFEKTGSQMIAHCKATPN